MSELVASVLLERSYPGGPNEAQQQQCLQAQPQQCLKAADLLLQSQGDAAPNRIRPPIPQSQENVPPSATPYRRKANPIPRRVSIGRPSRLGARGVTRSASVDDLSQETQPIMQSGAFPEESSRCKVPVRPRSDPKVSANISSQQQENPYPHLVLTALDGDSCASLSPGHPISNAAALLDSDAPLPPPRPRLRDAACDSQWSRGILEGLYMTPVDDSSSISEPTGQGQGSGHGHSVKDL